MSYTLRGRLESRLLAALAPAAIAGVLALALHRWWPLELAMLMVGVGLLLDVLVYDRVLDYQPGWLALPLGALELGIVTVLAYALRLGAPLDAAIVFFAASWLLAQVLGHAVYPLLRVSYGDDGGELGRAGAAGAAAVAVLFASAGGAAWAMRPPTVYLSSGVHDGPLVLDHAQTLIGRDGAVVRGGIVIRADDVIVRDVTVIGGENGIDVDESDRVRLERVHVLNSDLDGIHVRRSQIAIRDCTVALGPRPYTQGIDISFSMHRTMSSVEGCEVVGGAEGIVTHSSMVMVEGNRVHGTTLNGISMTEMSMGHVTENSVSGARGAGLYCGDYSECEISRNVVADTGSDGSGALARAGVGIVAEYHAHADLEDNVLVGNTKRVAALSDSRFAPIN